MQPDLIFDIGFHRGEDTEFYLKKGCRVVAVEANPTLCREAEARFAEPLASGQLTLVPAALAREPGEVTFFINEEESVWSTLDPLWADRNARLGARSRPVTVQATTMAHLLEAYGVPYYAKVDIEGYDMVAVEGLATRDDRPNYLSLESNKDSLKALHQEFDRLQELGYDRFKIVPQSVVEKQRCPTVEHPFRYGSSGCFGEEAPGRWLTADEAIRAYRKIFWRYGFEGDEPVAPLWARAIARLLGVRYEWYDTHAKHSTCH